MDELIQRSTKFFTNPTEDFVPGSVIAIDCTEIKEYIMDNVFISIRKQKKMQEGITGGIYCGTYGNAYTLLHLSKKTKFADEKEMILNTAVELISEGVNKSRTEKTKDPSDDCGFLKGKAGIYALGAVVFKEAGQIDESKRCIRLFLKGKKICLSFDYARFGGDELFFGRAGYLCGALWINHHYGYPIIPNNILRNLCRVLIASGREYSSKHRCKVPLMYHFNNQEYLGAGHGLASILFMLLTCNFYFRSHREIEMELKNCVDFFLHIQMTDGNYPCILENVGSDPGPDELVQWCHGGPGLVYLLLKAFKIWGEGKYLNSALKIGELVWEKGLIKKGSGLCHGVAGNGYVFIHLYNVTQDPKYLYRANEFCKFLNSEQFLCDSKKPNNPYGLFEGLGGTMCFMADVMEPENGCFPFMEIM